MWYCTSQDLPTLPGFLSDHDASIFGFVKCTRVSQAVVDDNGVDIARAFRTIIRIADEL